MSATMAPVQAINVLDPMRLRQRAQRPTPTPSHRRTRQHAKSPLSRSETPSTDDRPADALSMDEDALLDLCDSVRASLRDSQTLGARASHVGVVRVQSSMRVGTRTDKKQPFEDKVKRVEALLKEGDSAGTGA
ncbi:hypothetical protein BN1723_003581 [Verticillium longisporum]|uniref:Uncharacterized protein n=1 Tax=Verticillium longisporum TaxID=100787 RepID=A0A0G4M2K3_VERLO|nr:hypothetical protein BN1723_003581 [Verticillium longisporum]